MSSGYLVVVDEVHTAAGTDLQELCELLDQGISEYVKILNQITAEAAKEGRMHTHYQEYAGIVSGLQGQLARVGNTLKATATDFVGEIDKTDGYLY